MKSLRDRADLGRLEIFEANKLKRVSDEAINIAAGFVDIGTPLELNHCSASHFPVKKHVKRVDKFLWIMVKELTLPFHQKQ